MCSAWIGSGVARDLGDLRRVYQLLVTSLTKLKPPKLNSQRQSQVIFNESALTLEKLSILKAWAEVYIVSMKNDVEIKATFKDTDGKNGDQIAENNAEDDGGDDDDFGDFEESNVGLTKAAKQEGNRNKKKSENLGSLVQSELPSLSSYWMNALKDYALLALPPEFKSQLPFDGGAFYSHDTIDLARPHYKSTWPPILQAAAIWLSYGLGFASTTTSPRQDNDAAAASASDDQKESDNKSPEEINKDRLHLLLGVCVEGLANTRSADLTKDQVTSCLMTLVALLDHDWVRRYLASDNNDSPGSCSLILVELCNVLHRTVLTREAVSTQTLALDVLRLVLITSKERLDSAKKAKSREMGVPANQVSDNGALSILLGEGGPEGLLTPGKSVVFAALEVCLCVLVRHYPELSPRAANLSSAAALRARAGHHRSLQGHSALVNQAVELLARLPGLCSPKGALSILPSILWLLIGVIKATTPEEDVAGALKSLKILMESSSHFLQDRGDDESGRTSRRWLSLLQSALQRLLDLAKTSDQGDDAAGSEVNIITAVAVFLLHAPSEVFAETPGLKYPAVNAFVKAFQQQLVSDPIGRRRVVQAATSVLASADSVIAQPLAQAVASAIMDFLLVDESSRSIKTDADLALTIECVHLVWPTLMTSPNLAPPTGEEDKRASQLLVFLVPILVSHLLAPEDMKEASRVKLALHDRALASLSDLGQMYPHEVKAILGQSDALRGRLESAARAGRDKKKPGANSPIKDEKSSALSKVGQPSVPSIKLTMDFGKKYAS